MVKTNMSSNGPSLGPDPNSDSRKLSCRSETAVTLRGACAIPERVWPCETSHKERTQVLIDTEGVCLCTKVISGVKGLLRW